MMSESVIQTEDIEGLSLAGKACGSILKDAREQKNLTVEDVSSRLRLSVHQIQALENDDFSLLPSAATMTRGFIRNYARLLELDAEPLLQVYQALAAGQTNHSLTIKSENILITSAQKPVWKKYIISSLLILLVIGGWIIYTDYFHKSLKHESDLPIGQKDADSLSGQAQSVTNEPMPEPALPVAERDAPDEAIAPTPAESSAAGKSQIDNSLPVTTPAKSEEKATEPEKPSLQAPLAVAPAASPASTPLASTNIASTSVAANPKSSLKISLTFTDSTWVRVIDSDNKEVLNKTAQSGSQEKIEVTPPVKLVIGNANATQLEVNNKTIDLTPYNKLNVARLTLEQ